ncbi:MAG: twin-arginine translocase TatA/TatE family subunit [Actinomycetota bacterium]|nr:twin-arginine translocase TatA/TatE family subunit [Actinomycetota bacterium]
MQTVPALIDSEWSILLILIVVLLVFGGSQLPKLARSLGSASHEFRKGIEEGHKEGAAAGTSAAAGTPPPSQGASGNGTAGSVDESRGAPGAPS